MKKFVLILILIPLNGWAQLDKDSQKGLSQTQSMLQNPDERAKAIAGDAKAKDMDNKVKALTGGGANQEAVYGLASEIMEKITLESNGDAGKMQKLLEQAQRDPQAFYNKYFSAEQKARVSGVADKIDKSKPSVSPSH